MTIEHKDITDAERHEPKGASGASVGEVLTSLGGGATSFQDPNTLVDVGNVKTEIVLGAFSVAGSQQPSGPDLPIQIEFGNAVGSGASPVMMDNTGKITFNDAGNYAVRVILQYGRTGSTNVANLHARSLINGTQFGNTISASVDTAGILIASSITANFNVAAGTELTYELVRDSSGNNSGGLFSSSPTVANWNFSPTASVVIERVIAA